MSTKNVQTSQFDPTSMGTYQSLLGALGPAIRGYINSPFSNPFFQTQQQMGTQQANLYGQTGMSNIIRNLQGSGMSGGGVGAAQYEMLNNQSRANANMRANLGFLQPVQNALMMQQNAMGTAAGFRPLQTGQTQTQSGLGTWLPQIASMGLGLAGMAAGGGGAMPLMMMGQNMGSQLAKNMTGAPYTVDQSSYSTYSPLVGDFGAPASSGSYNVPNPFIPSGGVF